MVKISVGPEKQLFRVHKELLCSRSPYFKAMFTSGFAETASQSASLPEDKPDILGLFLEWVYGGRVLHAATWTRKTSMGNKIHLYNFAEKICLDELADFTMTSLMSDLREGRSLVGIFAVKMTYRETPAGSPLRKFLCHGIHYVTHTTKEGANWPAKTLCDALTEVPELLQDFIEISRELGGTIENPTEMPKCKFHKHAKGAECAYKESML